MSRVLSLLLMILRPPRSTLLPDTTLVRSAPLRANRGRVPPRPRGPRRFRREAAFDGRRRGGAGVARPSARARERGRDDLTERSEEHTSELQSRQYLV